MNIALVTYQDNGKYQAIDVANEDDVLLKFLYEKGINIKKEIWNDPLVNWENYDLAILKSTWDYFDHITDFYNWLARLESLGVTLLNPFKTVKWNADKHYLNDIAAANLKVTPSVFLSHGDEINLQKYFEKFNANHIIIKPVVSGGSKNTFKVAKDEAHSIQGQLDELLKHEDFIIQPFLKEIEENGEFSFLYFGGKFSHAILKKAKKGDFRVQATFGGTVQSYEPDQALIEKIDNYVKAFAANCLYARVDGAIIDDEFVLMELELIEPFLFLSSHPDSFLNYYKALKLLL